MDSDEGGIGRENEFGRVVLCIEGVDVGAGTGTGVERVDLGLISMSGSGVAMLILGEVPVFTRRCFESVSSIPTSRSPSTSISDREGISTFPSELIDEFR